MQNCVEIESPNGKSFDFTEHQVTLTVDNISTNGKQGNIVGELSVLCPYDNPVLTQTRELLTDSMARHRLVLSLKEMSWEKFVPWAELIDYAFSQCIKYYRRGSEIICLSSIDEVDPIKFDIEPLLLSDLPTTIYSDGGAGKSITALMLAVATRLPWYDNPLSLRVFDSPKANNVVWLDWETSQKVFQSRLHNFTDGMGLGFVDINYVFCEHNLAANSDAFFSEINALNPKLTVIDSIGAACAGDLNGSEAPTVFFNALRQITGTKLLLFHTNKAKELYGNRFFWNFSRAAWELKSQVEKNCISIALYHKKHNETKQYDPIAFEFEFGTNNGPIVVRKADISAIPELEQGMPLRLRIRALLLHDSMTTDEIATALDAKSTSIATILYRNTDMFTRNEDSKWGVLTRD